MPPKTAMAAHVVTYKIGSPRKKSEGLRIGTVRLLPRGLPKREYTRRNLFDVWLPLVAPSRELLAAYKDGKKTPQQFFRAYRAEMQRPEAKHTVALLAAISRHTPIAIGCYCEDESRCHRSVLIQLIRAAE
ncbi:MAG TPA: DUF488 family protein [Pirellulales bacterium]|jgi:uncharacterized protein YeaO (DUF488 family)|nr:DUF488 family protein [Pirellulales bacterium]